MKNRKSKMFSLIELLVVMAIIGIMAALMVPRVSAQSTNGPTLQSFPQMAIGYLTTVNTNLSWDGDLFELGVGGDYENGQQWGNNIDAQVNIGGGNIGIGGRMRNAGIAGTVEMEEAKFAYSISYYDIRVELGLYGGYDNEYTCGVIEPELAIRKKMTWNTFLGIYMSEPCLIGRHVPQGQQWVPNVGVETGCTLGGVGPNGQPVAFRTRVSHSMTAFRHFVSWSSY